LIPPQNGLQSGLAYAEAAKLGLHTITSSYRRLLSFVTRREGGDARGANISIENFAKKGKKAKKQKIKTRPRMRKARMRN
jgi:hypothetical protein